VAVVPARAAARRLPDKPLLTIGGEPLVARVVRRLQGCATLDEICVATDDRRIAIVAEAAGARVLMVREACASGTERVARALVALRAGGRSPRHVINVQGDEAFVEAGAVDALVARLRAGARVATLSAPLPEGAARDLHQVKVVTDRAGRALYFSRAPIPGDLHLGLYGFEAAALLEVAALPRGPLATAEDLEQLAWLEAGHSIDVARVDRATLSIDTPDDLARARALVDARIADTTSGPRPTDGAPA
jgi:3-deoxy-manno-octulosonate cytidylyltransferase (CMP-KDO synthetase)